MFSFGSIIKYFQSINLKNSLSKAKITVVKNITNN